MKRWVLLAVLAGVVIAAKLGWSAWRARMARLDDENDRLSRLSTDFPRYVDDCLRSDNRMSVPPETCRKDIGEDLDRLPGAWPPELLKQMRGQLDLAVDLAALRHGVVTHPDRATRDDLARAALARDRNAGEGALDGVGHSMMLAQVIHADEDHEVYRAYGVLAARDVADLDAWKRIALPSRRGTAGADDDWYLLRGASLCLLGERAAGRDALAEGASQSARTLHLSMALRACSDDPKAPRIDRDAGADALWPDTMVTASELLPDHPRQAQSVRAYLEARIAAAATGGPPPTAPTVWPLETEAHAFTSHPALAEAVDWASRRPGPRACNLGVAPEDIFYGPEFSAYDSPAHVVTPDVVEGAADALEGLAAPSLDALRMDLLELAARERLRRGQIDLARRTLDRVADARPAFAAAAWLAAGDAERAKAAAAHALALAPGSLPHELLARALMEAGEWPQALVEARAADDAVATCRPAARSPGRMPPARLRTMWLLAAASVKLGAPPPADLVRYEPDSEPRLRFEDDIRDDSEAFVLEVWRAAVGSDDERLTERMRVAGRWSLTDTLDSARLFVLSRLAGSLDAEVWLDAVEARGRHNNVGHIRGGARERAFCRATVARMNGDAAAAALWAGRLAALGGLVTSPATALLADDVGL